MAQLHPFRAWRPPAERASEVASVPYDVIDTAEARAMAQGRPHSFLHVIRPEIDLPEGIDVHSDAVYARGRENLERFIREIPFTEEGEPSLYVYRLRMGGREQTGVVGCCSVDEYDDDRIRKHERTRPDKEDDRTRHVVEMQCQAEPIFLAYRDRADIDALVAAAVRTPPLYDFTADDGVSHTVWRVAEPGGLVDAFARVPLLYVADGHHRAASAGRARAHFRDRNPRHTGNEEYNRVLATLFPAGQLRILPYNRVVADLRRTVDARLPGGARRPLLALSRRRSAARAPWRFPGVRGGGRRAPLVRLPHRAAAGGERDRRAGREPAAGRGARRRCSGSTIRGRARASNSWAGSAAPRSWRSASAKGAPPPPFRCSRPPWRS